MNIQQLIDSRQSLNELQFQSLLGIICYRQRRDTKAKVKAALRAKFYTIFDKNPFSKKFIVHNEFIEYKTSSFEVGVKEVKALREYILAVGEQ